MLIRGIQQLPPTPTINCNRHQAPQGYSYVLRNGVCVLIKNSTGQVAVAQAGVGFIQGTQQAATTIIPTASTVTTWLQSNKGLALLIGVGVYYFLTKK